MKMYTNRFLSEQLTYRLKSMRWQDFWDIFTRVLVNSSFLQFFLDDGIGADS